MPSRQDQLRRYSGNLVSEMKNKVEATQRTTLRRQLKATCHAEREPWNNSCRTTISCKHKLTASLLGSGPIHVLQTNATSNRWAGTCKPQQRRLHGLGFHKSIIYPEAKLIWSTLTVPREKAHGVSAVLSTYMTSKFVAGGRMHGFLTTSCSVSAFLTRNNENFFCSVFPHWFRLSIVEKYFLICLTWEYRFKRLINELAKTAHKKRSYPFCINHWFSYYPNSKSDSVF